MVFLFYSFVFKNILLSVGITVINVDIHVTVIGWGRDNFFSSHLASCDFQLQMVIKELIDADVMVVGLDKYKEKI